MNLINYFHCLFVVILNPFVFSPFFSLLEFISYLMEMFSVVPVIRRAPHEFKIACLEVNAANWM